MHLPHRLILGAALPLTILGGAGIAASPAAAAYVGATPACGGNTITGAGSSMQRALHNVLGASIVTGWQGSTGYQVHWYFDPHSLTWEYYVTPDTASTPLDSLTTVNPAATDGFGFPYTGTGAAPATNCVGFRAGGKSVRYASSGSGAGRKVWASTGVAGDRDVTADFIGTDEPLDATEESNVESAGLSSTTQVETFPIAQVAIAIIVNLPDGCQLHGLTGYRQSTVSKIERVFRGSIRKWGHLLGSTALEPTPTTTDTPRAAGSGDPSSCAQQVIQPVVRADSSGATFALKRVFDKESEYQHVSSLWTTGTRNYLAPDHNVDWPEDWLVTKPTATGGGAVADYVGSHPGSLSYVDLATARSKGFDFSNSLSDTKLWLALQAPSTENPALTNTNDPAKDAFSQSYRNTLSPPYNTVRKGAACSAAPTGGTSDRDYLDLLGTSAPASTQQNWFEVTGARPAYRKYEYPICTLAYVLAYDKYSRIPGYPEPKARSVFDYVRYLISTDAQKRLANLDYQGLPDKGAHPLRTIANGGLFRVSFN